MVVCAFLYDDGLLSHYGYAEALSCEKFYRGMCSFLLLTAVFTVVSPLQLLHGVVIASIEVFFYCELLCLMACSISGILAGGIPGFRIVLCCFTHSAVWRCVCCVFGFLFCLVFCHTNT